MDPGQWQELQSWCSAHGLSMSAAQRQQLDDYLRLLAVWAPRASLIGAREMRLMVRKHLADSLFAASLCPAEGRAVDLGSGAGLPGIPVGIARPRLSVDLVESRAKKASFLTAATRTLSHVQCVAKRIEDLEAETYDIALARALAPLERLLPLTRPVLRAGATLLAMKSKSYEADLASSAPGEVGFELAETSVYRLPTGEERVILDFRAV